MADSASNGQGESGFSQERLRSARRGCTSALGQLLELCRPYLLKLAREELPQELEGKGSPSDVVQQTYLEAHQAFQKFHGSSEEEFLAWLRCILLNNVENFVRLFRETAKRQIGREEELSPNGEHGPAAVSDSPSVKAVKREDLDFLIKALGRLPEDYRQVIHWHGQDRLTFEEIGRRMDRSAEAVRKLWARGVEQLREELGSSI